MPRDDWAKARVRTIQRSAWKIQQEQEDEDRAVRASLQHAYDKWNRKIHKSKHRKKKRASSGRPSGPHMATVSAGRSSAAQVNNLGVGLQGQPRTAANQRPQVSGKDGSNLRERLPCPPVPENPVTQAQPPVEPRKPMAPSTGPASGDQG